jgi:hypothetical protein
MGFDPVLITASQVHEIGNALEYLTGNSGRERLGPALAAFDPDDGIALEDCVFGGRVNLNGTITQHPQ